MEKDARESLKQGKDGSLRLQVIMQNHVITNNFPTKKVECDFQTKTQKSHTVRFCVTLLKMWNASQSNKQDKYSLEYWILVEHFINT